jgi:hypothetical protein
MNFRRSLLCEFNRARRIVSTDQHALKVTDEWKNRKMRSGEPVPRSRAWKR